MKLYPYEKVLVTKVLHPSMKKGRIILPTGGGKGVICREVFYRMVSSKSNKNNQFVGIVFTPRLILNKQWVTDFIEYFKNQNHPINFILVGSDKFTRKMSNKIEQTSYDTKGAGVDPPISTMNPKDIIKAVKNNKRKGINTIIISTYHSNKVVRSSNLTFNIAIYDEAHFLPGREDPRGIQRQKDDLFSATKIIAQKKIFTTATEKLGNVDEDEKYIGRGMNNEDIYGPEILGWKDEDGRYRRISPRDLIEFGSMLEPMVHVLGTDVKLTEYDDTDDINSVINTISANDPLKEREFDEKARVICEIFENHSKDIKEKSSTPKNIDAKMLVVLNGAGEMDGIKNTKKMKDLMSKDSDINIYFISCYTGVDMPGKDNKRVTNKSKEEFLDSLNNLRSNARAIIFHIDIMTCGLDVPALTGVLFFKSCKRIKLLQNLGRACRLHNDDRKKWESGKLKPGGKGYIKPNFYVILPICFEDQTDFINQFGKTITNIREDYDFDSGEFVHIGGGQPAHLTTEDDNGIIQGGKNIKSLLERMYYQRIEDRKKIKRREKQEKENNYIKEMSERGDINEIKSHMDSLLL